MDFDQIILSKSQIALLKEFIDNTQIQFNSKDSDRFADCQRLRYFDFVHYADTTGRASIKDRGRDYYMWYRGMKDHEQKEDKRWRVSLAISIITAFFSAIAIIMSINAKYKVEIIDYHDSIKQGETTPNNQSNHFASSEYSAPIIPGPLPPSSEPSP